MLLTVPEAAGSYEKNAGAQNIEVQLSLRN